ncbi:MAG: ACT domain-containing protein [Anaerolineae bacterium]
MMKDLTVILEDRPGTLADMGEALGKAGINIEGSCGFAIEGKGVGHILVEDAGAARRALEEVGIEVGDEREVLVLEIEDRPGALGEVSRRIANAGVNIELVYLATNTRLVIGADDLDKARAAL